MSVIVDVEKLKNVDGIHSALAFTIPPASFAGTSDLKPVSEVVFTGGVESLERTLTITGSLTGRFMFPCDRCGKEINLSVTVPVRERFTNLPMMASADGEEEIHLFEGNTIDLLPYLEQAIFLELPMKKLCREDCRGLCAVCGQDLNERKCSCDESPIDPRLAVLAELFHDDKE